MSTELFWKLNHATEENGATGEKHAPVISIEGDIVPGQKVKVHVSVAKHPSENPHFIQFIELRGNGLYIARAEIAPVVCAPVVTFELVVPTSPMQLTAVSRCNIHGLWESSEVMFG